MDMDTVTYYLFWTLHVFATAVFCFLFYWGAGCLDITHFWMKTWHARFTAKASKAFQVVEAIKGVAELWVIELR